MSLRYWLWSPDSLLDVTGYVRAYSLDCAEAAEEGTAATWTLILDDPNADLVPHGHKAVAVEETEAVDPNDRFIAVGFIGEMELSRGTEGESGGRVGSQRAWSITVSDVNTVLGRRVMIGGDNDRPIETDVERATWLAGTAEFSGLIQDTRYLSTDDPQDMDANDYLLQDMLAVFNDLGQQTGKNYFVTYFGDNGANDPNPWGYWSMWYGAPESTDYPSTARLTNDLADIDMVTTFPMWRDDKLTIDPMRIYSKVIVAYQESYVSAERTTTRDNYARREVVMSASNVKTKGAASRRASRYVKDLATPDYTAEVTTIVPRAYVNLIRPGMNLQVKATHWVEPFASTYTYMRVTQRRVVEVSEDDHETYELHLSLTYAEPEPVVPVFGVLYAPHGPYTGGSVEFSGSGDHPPTGKPLKPTTGLIHTITGGRWRPPYGCLGWGFDGDGTVDFELSMTLTGVRNRATSYTVEASILDQDGNVVASTSIGVPSDGSGFSRFTTSGAPNRITLTGTASVANGNEWYARLVCTPGMPFFRTPAGTDAGASGFYITGGSLS